MNGPWPTSLQDVELPTKAAPVDIVERLRLRKTFWSQDGVRWYMHSKPDTDCADAAAEIERLREALRVASAT